MFVCSIRQRRAEACGAHTPNRTHARLHTNTHGLQVIDAAEGGQVIFTYDVEWEMSSVKWASRWDVYLQVMYL